MSLTNEECSQLLDEIKIREARKNVGKYLKNKIEYDELYETLDKIFLASTNTKTFRNICTNTA